MAQAGKKWTRRKKWGRNQIGEGAEPGTKRAEGRQCLSHATMGHRGFRRGGFALHHPFSTPIANIQDEMRLRNFFGGMQGEAELPQVAPTPDQSAFVLLRLFGPNNEQQKQTAPASGR